ncbi:MAG: hypothetical protein LKH90_05050, partial [Levilactobacillus sp.]|nr:hypothetical protein [Levilactobacillus sp.]
KSYYDMSDSINGTWEVIDYNYWRDTPLTDAAKDRKSLVKAYDVFKGRFSGALRSNLDAMDKQVNDMQISSDNLDQVSANINTFAQALADAVRDLD